MRFFWLFWKFSKIFNALFGPSNSKISESKKSKIILFNLSNFVYFITCDIPDDIPDDIP